MEERTERHASATSSTSVQSVSRRAALRTAFVLAVCAGTGGALARIVDAPGAPAGGTRGQGRPGSARSTVFDETYRGHRLQGYSAHARGGGPHPVVEAYIDGRPLHLMRCAGGGYLSPLDHYESYPTAREAARAAAVELGTTKLATGTAHGGAGRGEAHGVHA
ncbi:tyrosinase family oxidase copper chaperone [Streptomyces sp. NPDC050504]|uniref:tyrosinase family oxidase copper chaperone n=1 Tax=Streptomyces sp. NPDC050504 TaxID=3365618 RepID=UPI00379CBAF3